ncbi:MAG: threonylcarbamoyl-AMP synthase [Armatimonadetes bacterium]|nr:threonylcarbamoyl-AMP synthase [Armatimonadota bacterium]
MARLLPATPDAIAGAARIIRDGGLVAFPTETVYGLGANALDAGAVARIFAAKGRPASNPLIVHVASPEEIDALAYVGAQHAAPLQAVTDAFWPGPLTLVLPRKPVVPDTVTAGGPTVAVRMPRHSVALALIRAAGVPLAAPSANRSEQLSPTRAEHVAQGLGDAVDLILDGGPTDVGLESTVLDLTEWPPRLLRPGMVTAAEIESVLGVPISAHPAPNSGGSEPARSPGRMPRHYAPRTRLRVVTDVWAEATCAAAPVAVLAHTSPPADLPPHVQATILPAEPRAYAAHLYEALHQLDRLAVSLILVQAVPETDDWLAVRDRLGRAGA